MISLSKCKQRTRHRVHLMLAGLVGLFVLATLSWNSPASPALVNQTNSSKLTGQAYPGLLADYDELSVGAAAQTRLSEAYGRLPLSFEPNRGQTDTEVRFLSRGAGYSLFLTSSQAVLALSVAKTRGKQRGPGNQPAVVRIEAVGANTAAVAEGLYELPTRHNYFIGNDPSKWRTAIPAYAKVKYHAIYPGIDLVYYGNQQQLEYDFVIAPGADPEIIKLRFEGAESLNLDSDGDLILRAAGGEIRQHRPIIYQEIKGWRQEVTGRYVMGAVDEVGFEVGDYDASRPLVIDPVIAYSTFFGGSGAEFAADIAVGPDGSFYITGRTTSIDFPTVNALQPSYGGEGSGPGGTFVGLGDAYVARLNAEGSALVYSTYLGGSTDERGSTVTVDASGAAYITGMTNSTDFPTMNAFKPTFGGGTCNFGMGDFPCFDAFVTKLSATGSLVYSTYLGGNQYDDGRDIAVDAGGNAYITGNTFSSNFPTLNPIKPELSIFQDSFITKLSATGDSLVYSTFLGGATGLDREAGQGIAVDADGNAYVAGVTNVVDFPQVKAVQDGYGGGVFDAYLTKINASGSALLYSTYLGGSGDEAAFHTISIDSTRNIYVAGQTNSTNFPTVNALQQNLAGELDIFVAKLATTGAPPFYSTYFGGSGNDIANNIATDANGNTYIVGNTASADFPVVNGLQQTFGGGASDAFVLALNPSGSTLFYSTYIGTAGLETSSGVALNRFGNLIVLGRTSSPDFPVLNALQPTYGGGAFDAFIIKITDAPESRRQCMNGGWRQFGPPAGPFRNQGECIRHLQTGE